MSYSPFLNPHPVTVSGSAAVTGPLTDGQLRASAISVTFTNASLAVTGPLTDAQLRATPVSVSGTFWQATQPVSGTITANAGTGTFAVSAAALPLPTGAATETTVAALNTKTPGLGQAAMAASSPVVIASNQSAVPVSGTFWQATQPVSGTVTVGNASLAVTGTFWQATQPVSLASLPSLATGSNVIGAVTQSGTWNIGSIATLPALAAGSNTIGTTLGPALTKGTQGATGYSVQDLKDAGRTSFAAATVIGGVACVTAEALLSMVPVRAGTAAAAATSISVTAGKRLRITSIIFSARSTAAAVLSGRCALRINPTGAVTATSPILAILSVTQQAAAVAEGGDTCVVSFPDGIEISGTEQIGLTQLCSATTGVVYASIVGFEY